MTRLLIFVLFLLGFLPKASADHITGGEIFYTYLRNVNGTYEYSVTVRLFMRCYSGREFSNPTVISIFDKSTGARIFDYNVPISNTETLSLTNNNPCITNPPLVCYQVAYYRFNVSLPESSGYVITAHVNYRIDGINNFIANYDRVGATYIGEIPGWILENAAINNSAHFVGEDLVIVCAGNFFTYNFAASDADGDELRYSFCNAYRTTGGGGFGNNVLPPPPPPYQSVPYGNGFTSTTPLGNDVRIDPKTGLISGTAPPSGTYVVTVCVEEIRNGKVIATQHKDLQINIAPCSIAAAALPDEYMLCGNSQTLNARNQSTSTLVNTYNWEVLNQQGDVIHNSTSSVINYTFSDTGIYQVKLVINRNGQCSDSSTAIARVYPGFEPEFSISGPCISKPVQFLDETISALGTTNFWQWDFGEFNDVNDIAETQNAVYSYPSTGDKLVRLIAGNSLGCRDTLTRIIDIFDKPPLDLAFRDTLICPPDQFRLQAAARGNYRWAPHSSLQDETSASPLVAPTATTTYYVELDQDGCTNSDSVKVQVVDRVQLNAMENTMICEGDSIQLSISSNALRYEWSPVASVDNGSAQQPFAMPVGTTNYQVTGYISNCIATDNITITTVPYPVVNAGTDTSICFNTSAQLNALTDGSSFSWIPASLTAEMNSLNPTIRPSGTTSYIIYAYDTRGCPKPGIDTVTVFVEPEIIASAGADTAVVINQPLQLKASGGALYKWLPAAGLSADDVPDPVARFSTSPAEGYYIYKVLISNPTGCTDSASLRVKVFSSMPEIYVPSAFTPNGDGRNDFFQLVAAGIRSIRSFRVYNRWGQLLFDSPLSHSPGWSGDYGGQPQPSGTYVWVVQAEDYLGQPIQRRGTVTLIR